MARRHSIAIAAIGSTTNPSLPTERQVSFPSNITGSMSAGLNLLQRKLSRDQFSFVESDLCVDKSSVQAALVRHYGDDKIKV